MQSQFGSSNVVVLNLGCVWRNLFELILIVNSINAYASVEKVYGNSLFS